MSEEPIDYVVVVQAELMATQTLLAGLCRQIGRLSPELADAVIEAFDEAENFVNVGYASVPQGAALPDYARHIAFDVLHSLRPTFGPNKEPKQDR